MVGIASLIVPVLVSAVIVFLGSWLLHMLLPYHRSDWKKLPSEDETMEALRRFNIPEGNYHFPHAAGPEAMKDKAWVDKRTRGPVAILTVLKSGPPSMGAHLVRWFLYCIAIALVAAYVTGRALPAGSHYLAVFRFAGTTAFACFALGQPQESIWYGRSWGTTVKYMADGLIYGCLMAGTFGWLWPR